MIVLLFVDYRLFENDSKDFYFFQKYEKIEIFGKFKIYFFLCNRKP